MAEIFLSTQIESDIQTVFDLSRSIELHLESTKHTGEVAIAGVTTGLIGLNEEVTWQARHLFKQRRFTSRITAMQAPNYFCDEMKQGDFKEFLHEHFFEANERGTLMKDRILLEAPYGILGKLVTAVFLKNYIKSFVEERNKAIKDYAEKGTWQKILA